MCRYFQFRNTNPGINRSQIEHLALFCFIRRRDRRKEIRVDITSTPGLVTLEHRTTHNSNEAVISSRLLPDHLMHNGVSLLYLYTNRLVEFELATCSSHWTHHEDSRCSEHSCQPGCHCPQAIPRSGRSCCLVSFYLDFGQRWWQGFWVIQFPHCTVSPVPIEQYTTSPLGHHNVICIRKRLTPGNDNRTIE